MAAESTARQPPSKDDLDLYMKSREVIRTETAAVVVDGFRFTSHYLQQCYQAAPPGIAESGGFRTVFILTHFHSDHYIGLHKSWAFGKILCSKGTGGLLQSQFGFTADRIVGLEMDQPYVLDLRTGVPEAATDASGGEPAFALLRGALQPHQVLLTLVGANHCPAAVMLVFESPRLGTIVHTGDFRYNGRSASSPPPRLFARVNTLPPALSTKKPAAAMTAPGGFRERLIGDHPTIQRVSGTVDVLFLDNTFCERTFRFPPQVAAFHQVTTLVEEAFSSAFEAKYLCRSVAVTQGDAMVQIRGDSRTCSCHATAFPSLPSVAHKCLHIAVLVGTYTIGKERVALAVRNRFGVPVHLSPAKADILESCLAAEELGCGADAFRRVATSEDIIETRVQLAAMADLAAKCDTCRALSFAGDGDDASGADGDLRLLLTLVLVPLGALTYPSLAEGLGFRPGGAAQVEGEANSPTMSDSMPVKTEGDSPPQGQQDNRKSNVPAIRLWEGCALNPDKFDAIVGIEPTGWTEGRSASRMLKKVGRKVTVHSVPYSEHCSFDEMLDFVALLKPTVVVPTVSVEMFTKCEPLFVERCPRLRSKYSNTQPLSRFQHLFKKPLPHPVEVMPPPPTPAAVVAAPISPVDVGAGLPKQVNPFGKRLREEAAPPPRPVKHAPPTVTPDAHGVTLVSDDDGDDVVVLPTRYVIDDD